MTSEGDTNMISGRRVSNYCYSSRRQLDASASSGQPLLPGILVRERSSS